MEASGGNSDAYRGSSMISSSNSRRYGMQLSASNFFHSPLSTLLEYSGILRTRSSYLESESSINSNVVSVGYQYHIQNDSSPVANNGREVSIRIIGASEQEHDRLLPPSMNAQNEAVRVRFRESSSSEMEASGGNSDAYRGSSVISSSNSRRYGMLLSASNFFHSPLSTLLEYSGILRTRSNYLESESLINSNGVSVGYHYHIQNDSSPMANNGGEGDSRSDRGVGESGSQSLNGDGEVVDGAGSNSRDSSYQRYNIEQAARWIEQGQMLTLVEFQLLLYRALLPAPVWYRFFLNKEYGSLFSSLMTGLYLTFKLTSVVEKVLSPIFLAVLKALSRKESHYGAYATSE
ncbi:hypothetical protein LOK49_LG10G02453 [Camellia lanceoleosa]|uniref:Uncharacterized protein n=1 Tax=Camellia lanceoleosa TaxID=1840588 RepID=A0ACC0G9R8_9ERIC|nr:hypothetical protein LOK49_LG10G02453 [Camellia lanceoleosa]